MVEVYSCASGRSECMQGSCIACVPSGLEIENFTCTESDSVSDNDSNKTQVSFKCWGSEDGKIQ